MQRLVILSTAVCLLSQSSFLYAQLELQSRFPITNGSVYTITGRNDTLFVGGQFQYIGPKVEALGFMDLNGKRIAVRITKLAEEVFDLSELAQGVYILQISSNGALYRERVVKQ